MNKGKIEDGASLAGASRFPSLTSSRKRKETEPGKQSRDLTRNSKMPCKSSSGLQSVPEDTSADDPAAKTRLPPLRTQEAVSASKSQPGKKEAKLKGLRLPSCSSKSSSMVRLISNQDSSVQPDSKLEFRPKTGLKLDLTEQRFPPLFPPTRPPGQPSARSKRLSRRPVAVSDSEKAPLTLVLPHIETPAVSRTAALDSQMDVSYPVPSTRIILQKQTKVASESLPSLPTSMVGRQRPSYLLKAPSINLAVFADSTQESPHPFNPVSKLVVAPPTSAKPQKRTSQKVRRQQARADQASEASQDISGTEKSCLFPPISRHPPDGDGKTPSAPLRPQAPRTRPPQAPRTRPPQARLRPQASEQQPALLPKRRAMDMEEGTSCPERMLDPVAEQSSFSQLLMPCPSTPPQHMWMHSSSTQEEHVFLPDFGQMFEEGDLEMMSGNKREILRGEGSR